MTAPAGSLAGRLLVAAPPLGDPNFDRTVVYLVEHGAEGALGVVLNRPSHLPVADPFPDWAPLTAEPDYLFIGGPVQPGTSALALGRPTVPEASDHWVPVAGGVVGVVDLHVDPHDASPPFEVVRVFSGYSGWGSGQLEAELEAGAWFVLPAQPSDVFTAAPDRLWHDVLRRQGGRYATLANHPPDLSMN